MPEAEYMRQIRSNGYRQCTGTLLLGIKQCAIGTTSKSLAGCNMQKACLPGRLVTSDMIQLSRKVCSVNEVTAKSVVFFRQVDDLLSSSYGHA